MIERYSLKQMSSLWSLESRFFYMLKVEQAVAKVQGELGIIPKKAAQSIKSKSKFSVREILRREKKTCHDVTAFVEEVASSLGADGVYVHYGLTSSDVLDTALSLQIRESSLIIRESIKELKKILRKLVQTYKGTLCSGRTHGIHAEPTSFGFKMLGYLAELERAEETYNLFTEQSLVIKLSGAVGTYSSLSSKVEDKAGKILKLKPETIATQVVPRDRFARLIFSLSLFGSFLERLSVELRHLQRTEVSEVMEGFKPGQTGSSAMPHKKNPISSENLVGVARLLRSYVSPSLENISLWHERDISHSSVERVIFPDAFTLVHYGLDRMTKLLKGLKVNQKKMLENLWSSQGIVFSSQILNSLVAKGLSREKSYFLIQSISHKMKKGERFKDLLKKDPQVKKYLSHKDLEDIFSGQKHLKPLLAHIKKVLKEI